eukprot:gene35330-42811_t
MLGSQLAMPILVLNMGGEMIYILHQRLQAQNIPEEKARKVLEDVLKTMYTPVFLEELFKPQDVYTNASTKQIFDKLAHSSIMRLNKTSMEKLYDLMSMGVKYQLLSCTCPQQYLHVTINHLDSLMHLVESETVNPLIQSAATKAIRTYASLSPANWLLLEQTLMQFFQGRKVKVSLFLQQNLQTINGVLILNNQGPLPYLSQRPGEIHYFENDQLIRTAAFHSEIANNCSVSKQYLDPAFSLGKNMYNKPIDSPSRQTVNYKDACAAFSKNDLSLAAAPKSTTHSPPKASKYSTEVSAKAELSLLADLLGASDVKSPAKGVADDKPFKINLFPSQPFGAKADADMGDGDDEAYDSSFIMLDLDASAGAKTMDHYMADLRLRDDDFKASAKGGADDDDDLLALMDSAK